MEKKNANNIPFSLSKYFSLCIKYWYLFAISIVALLVLALAFMYVRKPAYEVDAQLMLPSESAIGSTLGMNDLASALAFDNMFSSSTENEIMILKSYNVFKQTAIDLDLNISYYEKHGFLRSREAYAKSQLVLTPAPMVSDTVASTLLFKISEKKDGNFDIFLTVKRKKVQEWKNVAMPVALNTKYGDFTLDKTPYFGTTEKKIKDFKILFRSYSAAAEIYSKRVNIYAPNKKADFIDLSFITQDPAFGQVLLDKIIENYNKFGYKNNYDKNNRTLEFLSKQIEAQEQSMANTLSKFENFKKSNNLTDVEIDVTLALEKASMLDGTILKTKTEKEILHNTITFLQNPENNYSLIPSINPGGSELSASSAAAASEIGTYNELIMERMRMLASAKPSNAALIQLNNQLDAFRSTIISSVERALANVETQLKQLEKENQLTQSLKSSFPTLESEYIGLQTEVKLQTQFHLLLLRQREEAQLNIWKEMPALVTVNAPYTLNEAPGLTNPVIILLALIVGFIIPLIIIYYQLMDRAKITSPTDISDICSAPLIGSVDKAEGDAQNALNERRCGESIRMLRSNVLFAMDEFKGRIILVTSAKPGEGKTFLSTNLAKSLALRASRTLIIDANLRTPQVAAELGAKDMSGLAEYIQGADAQQCIDSVSLGNGCTLDVMGSGKSNANPADILSEETLEQKIRQLLANYDYIVIDTAALQLYSDTFSLADTADITLYVARIGLTTIKELQYSNSLFDDKRLKRIAMVANGDKA